MTELQVTALSKSFGPTKALDSVELRLDKGSSTALVGPSGCGKTTLLRIVAGFERPDSGEVSIGGRAVSGSGANVAPERRSIGYVAQEGALFPHLSVRDNLEFALSRHERRAGTRLTQLLDLVSLETILLPRFPHQLSGGQQQRVALARALARRPRLVLLDEPFAALDAGLRTGIRDLVSRALTSEGVTTLLVTHDQEEALSFADQVVVMRGGRITQSGAPDEVYARPVDEWTAGFLGDSVVLTADVVSGVADCSLGRIALADPCAGVRRARILLRPEQILLTPAATTGRGSAGSVAAGPVATVLGVSYFGHDTVITASLQTGTGQTIRSRVPARSSVAVGDTVTVTVAGTAVAFRNDAMDVAAPTIIG